jgi:hypothetical protein
MPIDFILRAHIGTVAIPLVIRAKKHQALQIIKHVFVSRMRAKELLHAGGM